MNDFADCTLGVTNKLIDLTSTEENRLAAVRMAQQCVHTLEIVSRLLDPPIFNTTEFIDAVTQIVLKKRNPQIRIIVFDPDTIVRDGHRLVTLAGSLSSFIHIRKAPQEYKHYNESLLIADGAGYIHKLNVDRYEAVANFNDRGQANVLLREFDRMWEKAVPDPNLRRMAI